MSKDPYAWIEQSLATIHKADWYRAVQTIDSRPGAIIQMEGRSLINFASNDYLGLAGDVREVRVLVYLADIENCIENWNERSQF
jgi:8-amino-7-oxononanoate synthase